MMSVVEIRDRGIQATRTVKPVMRVAGGIQDPAPVRNPRQRVAVRPDMPRSDGKRSLYAVPSAASPARILDSRGSIEWRLDNQRRSAVSAEPAASLELWGYMREGFAVLRAGVKNIRLRGVAYTITLFATSILAAVLVASFFGLAPQAGESLVVQPGDTIASIVESLDAPVESSRVVSDIYALNVIDGGVVRPGQKLILPRY
ncbi:LysM peptidoglycan-binding domain-containing protein [Arcanobacterium haemolyticum]